MIVASRRPPEALAPQARAIGPTVVAKSLRDAVEADAIILAVSFVEQREASKALPSWKGKTAIDAMNASVPLEELDGLLSSAFVAKAFSGAIRSGFAHTVAYTSILGVCDSNRPSVPASFARSAAWLDLPVHSLAAAVVRRILFRQ